MSTPEETAKKFLNYLFSDISFEYASLTRTEKNLCTEEEFNELMKWVKSKPTHTIGEIMKKS